MIILKALRSRLVGDLLSQRSGQAYLVSRSLDLPVFPLARR